MKLKSIFKKLNKIHKYLVILIKERTQINSEIKEETFQLIPQKYNELLNTKQLTLESHRELCGSTYMQIFSINTCIVFYL